MFEHAPSIDILGSFFPVWMPCLLGALILTLLARLLLIRVGLEGELGPRIIIYPSMLTLFACGIWLIGFRY
jgi:YtcA family